MRPLVTKYEALSVASGDGLIVGRRTRRRLLLPTLLAV
jgi:hypothetical protein